MAQIIASSYEIVEKIGSGGTGIVYLAKHLRLGKWVVLKADKRTLATKPEALRREVDALKNLSHSYIPQVYDFVVEGDTVYTVMDYIEGESLDQPLKRGESFSQVQVIKWACQLLEALAYLHTRPPHGILHSDIKPANIMVTPDNDVKLIDFNIALALGEEGAVRVGFSRGYASPEHYGIEFAAVNTSRLREAAETHISAETVMPSQKVRSINSSSSSTGHTMLLDVRSDIYSLGATLYHLLTGKRPAQNAEDVEPISVEAASPAVAVIVAKAMAPNPDARYQSAAEMLDALRHLHENDPRSKRHRRRSVAALSILLLLFLAGGICTFTGLRGMERAQAQAAEEARLAEEAARAAEAAERETKLALDAVTGSEEAYRSGSVTDAVRLAKDALARDTIYSDRAQKALTDALGVYDLSDGYKSHVLVELPSEPLKVELSPGGTHLAVMVSGNLLIFETETGIQLAELPAENSAWSDVVFLDDDRVLFAGEAALKAYHILDKTELWSGGSATEVTLSGDHTVAAAVDRDENQATIYDVESGAVQRVVTFQNNRQSVAANDVFLDPENDIFSLNEDGSLLAVSFEDGSLTVFDLTDSNNDFSIFDSSEFVRFEGGFFSQYLAFSASGGGQSVFAVIDADEKRQTGGFSSTSTVFHVQTNQKGIFISSENILVTLHPETGEQKEVAYTDSDISRFAVSAPYIAVATTDGAVCFYGDAVLLEKHAGIGPCDFVKVSGEIAVTANSNAPNLRILKLERHPDAQIFSYEREYPHFEARLNWSETTIMLFRYDSFRLYGLQGEILAEAVIPNAAQVYDQQYHKAEAGSYLEVTYNDGLVHTYSAESGELLSEKQGDAPDRELFEEFTTNRFRIERPLHGTPVAYDKETGEEVRPLESDAYLTYVTQVADYVITEYMTSQGDRYGLLLDENLETLASLPNLCDITKDGLLIFDDMRGNLRESSIYSRQELLALADEK